MKSVALFTRAWIEIHTQISLPVIWVVALFTRAWIEIDCYSGQFLRGLVALFTRAWIEIKSQAVKKNRLPSRPLYEGVD